MAGTPKSSVCPHRDKLVGEILAKLEANEGKSYLDKKREKRRQYNKDKKRREK